mmetsp:Transcript_7806/g.11826  ORF Transcript_7806/g.11826 Transcript_7806/m.11826 type:complete len:285 (-) Transcript_7806:176-1030(-)
MSTPLQVQLIIVVFLYDILIYYKILHQLFLLSNMALDSLLFHQLSFHSPSQFFKLILHTISQVCFHIIPQQVQQQIMISLLFKIFLYLPIILLRDDKIIKTHFRVRNILILMLLLMVLLIVFLFFGKFQLVLDLMQLIGKDHNILLLCQLILDLLSIILLVTCNGGKPFNFLKIFTLLVSLNKIIHKPHLLDNLLFLPFKKVIPYILVFVSQLIPLYSNLNSCIPLLLYNNINIFLLPQPQQTETHFFHLGPPLHRKKKLSLILLKKTMLFQKKNIFKIKNHED